MLREPAELCRYGELRVSLTCTFFLSSSSSFRRAPALLALSFILNTEHSLQTEALMKVMRTNERGNKKRRLTFPTLPPARHSSGSGSGCRPPKL